MTVTNALDPVIGQPQTAYWQFNDHFGVLSATDVTLTSTAGEFTLSNADASISTVAGELFISLTAGGALTLNSTSLSLYLPNNSSNYSISGDDVDMSITLNTLGGTGNFSLTAATDVSISAGANGSVGAEGVLTISSNTDAVNLNAQTGVVITTLTGNVTLNTPAGNLVANAVSGIYLDSSGSGFQVDAGDTVVYNAGSGGTYFSIASSGNLLCTTPNNTTFASTAGDFTVNATSGNIVLNSANVKLSSIASASTANVLFYDSVTKVVSYAATPSGILSTVVVTGTSQAVSVNINYIAKNVALTTFTLPVTAAIGDTFVVVGYSAGLFSIAQNAGQSIRLGTSLSTVGVGGSITSTAQGDVIEIQCVDTDNEFQVVDSVGSFNVV